MNTHITRIALLVLLLAWATPALTDDRRGGEAGIVIGFIGVDDELTINGDEEIELTVGLRGGSVFTPRVGWFIDGLYSEIDTATLGEARTVVGRSGIDLLFTPERRVRWLVSFGAGWMVVDYENSAVEDFHNPLASLGFGQRIRIGENLRMRWELRVDQLLDDARLNDELTQGMALLSLTWGPAGVPSAYLKDRDGDGVRDGRDRCPQTPPGADVNERGCTLDDDRDGIPNGIDRCPDSRRRERVGADGCPADADGDGVADQTDICPATPAEASVDEWGCPRDTDGDGVVDGIDRCPATPRGARVDDRGCASDGDGDGVVNGVDRCPTTPTGTPVDALGCARDSDGDGVHDGIDACPDTARSTRVVDARGCVRAESLFEPGQTELVLRGVQFEHDSATLTPASREVLDQVGRSLVARPDGQVEIAGHTDSIGDEAYNLRLSQRRAEAVRDYLVGRGVAAVRLVARGYGETRAIADNTTPDGQARNRRVELRKR